LESEGKLTIEERTYLGKIQRRPIALVGPDLSLFSEVERQVCDYVLKFLTGVRAASSSDWSHRFPGYTLTQEDEEIPYHTAWLGKLAKPPVTAADHKWAQDVIQTLR